MTCAVTRGALEAARKSRALNGAIPRLLDESMLNYLDPFKVVSKIVCRLEDSRAREGGVLVVRLAGTPQ